MSEDVSRERLFCLDHLRAFLVVLVFLAYAIRDAGLPALLEFGLAAVIVIPACFAAAWVIRKIPLVLKVL